MSFCWGMLYNWRCPEFNPSIFTSPFISVLIWLNTLTYICLSTATSLPTDLPNKQQINEYTLLGLIVPFFTRDYSSSCSSLNKQKTQKNSSLICPLSFPLSLDPFLLFSFDGAAKYIEINNMELIYSFKSIQSVRSIVFRLFKNCMIDLNNIIYIAISDINMK